MAKMGVFTPQKLTTRAKQVSVFLHHWCPWVKLALSLRGRKSIREFWGLGGAWDMGSSRLLFGVGRKPLQETGWDPAQGENEDTLLWGSPLILLVG